MPVDYRLAKIYKIESLNPDDESDIYIGSTCEPTLARRLAKHVSDYIRWKNGKKHFITSFTIIEGGNYDIVLIEDCPCTRQDELHKRERFYIESISCVNKFIPSRTKKESTIDPKTYDKMKKKEGGFAPAPKKDKNATINEIQCVFIFYSSLFFLIMFHYKIFRRMSVLPKYNILYNYEQRYWQDFLKKCEIEE
jgi:hypothetical protein